MILVIGRFNGLTSEAIVAALRASTLEPIRFGCHRPIEAPPSEDIDRIVIRAGSAPDRRRALDGVRAIVLIPSLHRTALDSAAALIQDARLACVERIVMVSLIAADPRSPVEILRRMGRLERTIVDSGLPYTILRCAPFMQNIGLFERK